jgi:hypothetical protein
MTTNSALAVRRVQSLEPQTVDEARELTREAVASRLYQVTSPESALMIVLTGRDLGLSLTQSLRSVYVVNGKPVISSDAMVAAIRKSGLCATWRVVESTINSCTIETRRVEEEQPESETFTLDDAKRAGLDRKEVWRAWPKEMLRHRCAAALARRVYPDVILGCYVPGEIDDPPVEPMRVEVTPSKPSRSKLSDEDKAERVAAIIDEYRAALARGENADAAYDAAKKRGRDEGVATLVQDALQREMSADAERKRAEYDAQQTAYSRLVSELDSAETSAAVIAVWTDNAAAIKLLPEQHRRQAWSETVARWSAVGGEGKGQGLRDALNERGEP